MVRSWSGPRSFSGPRTGPSNTTAIYRRCRTQMIVLGASQEILSRYQELCEKELRVSTAIADPNARGHRDDTLAWFCTMDVPRDTAMNNWMSECLCSIIMLPCPWHSLLYLVYRVHWLRTKALRDRWQEEVQLLTCEADWTQGFFSARVEFWSGRRSAGAAAGNAGLACYAARQCQMYERLHSLCWMKWHHSFTIFPSYTKLHWNKYMYRPLFLKPRLLLFWPGHRSNPCIHQLFLHLGNLIKQCQPVLTKLHHSMRFVDVGPYLPQSHITPADHLLEWFRWHFLHVE